MITLLTTQPMVIPGIHAVLNIAAVISAFFTLVTLML
jgi:hypothetical protein